MSLKSRFIGGTGFITSFVMKSSDDDWNPAYRWDKPSSSYYDLRPDRLIRNFHYFTDPTVRLRYDIEKLDREFISPRGGGGPSGTTPTSTTASGSNGRTARTNTKASWKPGGKGRTPCPKGHYWSYKKKKCVKSKFK